MTASVYETENPPGQLEWRRVAGVGEGQPGREAGPAARGTAVGGDDPATRFGERQPQPLRSPVGQRVGAARQGSRGRVPGPGDDADREAARACSRAGAAEPQQQRPPRGEDPSSAELDRSGGGPGSNAGNGAARPVVDRQLVPGWHDLGRRRLDRPAEGAWLLADGRVSVVLGPRRPEHLRPGLAALESPLTPEEREAISDEFRLVPTS